MSISNKFSSTNEDNSIIPLDLYYENFLKSLSDIHDETIRDRCHKYWITLYQYFIRSVANEQALIIEEKRIRKILHQLDMDIVSRQSKIDYQVRNILERGQQFLSNIHLKYRTKTMESNRIQIENTSINSSSTLDQELLNTIDHLKSNIKDLQLVRTTMKIKLNLQKETISSSQMKISQIEHKLHQMSNEYLQIKDHSFHLTKENLDISNDYHSLKEQINHNEQLILNIKKENNKLDNQLSQQFVHLQIQINEQKQFEINQKDLLEKIHFNQNEIEQEKFMKQEIIQMINQLKKDLKTKQKHLSIHHQQILEFQNKIIELKHQHNFIQQHSINPPSDQSLKYFQTSIEQQVNNRLKLTIIHHDLQNQIHNLQQTINDYTLLVKEQRTKILNYEIFHDKWIRHMNINRKRLLNSFNRIHYLTQIINKTKDFLDSFQINFQSDHLIIYHQMNIFIQQRRENNSIDSIKNQTSYNMQISQLKKRLQINRIIRDEIKENLIRLNHNQSFLFNQINIHRNHFIHYHHYLENKSQIIEQNISHMIKIFHQIQDLIKINQNKFQQFNIEKHQIVRILIEKQYWIIHLNKYLLFNNKIFQQYQLKLNQLYEKIKRIRLNIFNEYHLMNLFKGQNQIDYKQMIFSLEKQLLETRKKRTYLQHQQILTKIQRTTNKSIKIKEQSIDWQEKASSIIHCLIKKIHKNIRLHQHLDILMRNFSYLNNRKFSMKYFYLFQWNNRIKSLIVELRILKMKHHFYEQLFKNIQQTYDDHRREKTGSRLSDVLTDC